MFEARLIQGGLLKKCVDALKDLVNECNLDVSTNGIQLQAMDTSHVCLVAMLLRNDGFEHYRCDRPLTLGINMGSLQKILKCAGNEDIITLRANDDGDSVTLMFESPKSDRISDFELKLMDIDQEHLGIPDTEYSATVRMPAADYGRVVKDLATIGETVTISTSKEGVKFGTSGDVGTANITIRQNAGGDKPEQQTLVEINENVALSFALRYLNSFAKAVPLSPQVKISMSKNLPVVVEFPIADMGYMRFYLAPKIDEEEEDAGAGGEMED